jgi:predicted SAM-dependent methyltransferase
MAPFLKQLEGRSIALTPHFLSPLEDAATLEVKTRQGGVYNGGFVGIRRTKEANAFLEWWAKRLRQHCIVDVHDGIFVDQSWLDLVPGHFADVMILRDPGYNVGYWNLRARPLGKGASGSLTAANAPLVCFHFSGFDPTQATRLSKHQDLEECDQSPLLAEHMQAYAERLLGAGWAESRKEGYAFAALNDGTKIDPMWREAIRQGRLRWIQDPFNTQANSDLITHLTWEGREAWPVRQDWRFSAMDRLCHEEERWRVNYWHLADSFPIRHLLRLRRLLQGAEAPSDESRRRFPLPLPLQYHPVGSPKGYSETARCRARLAPYCEGYGVDLGFGGEPVLNASIRVDMPTPYTKVGDYPVQLGGDAADLKWFRDGALDYVFSSHVLEDFEDTEKVLREWLRVLRPAGRLVLYCPDEQRYRKHCRETGQSYNANHRQPDFSLGFVKDALKRLGQTRIIHENAAVEEYSWELVCEKQVTSAGGSGVAC